MLPAGASWLNDHYQAILLEQQQVLTEQHQQALARQQAAALPWTPAAAPVGGEGEAAAAPASQDTTPTSVR